MAEETEGQDAGAEAVAGGADAAAVALALGGASRGTADAFLNDQRALIADQRHHLHEQLKHLHLSVWEKRLGVLLRAGTAVVGIAVAAAVGMMVWDAAHSKGLLIEPFAVSSDMVEKGLTGQVVASQVLDRLTTMDAATLSFRPPLSYVNNWGKDIKVEIPETGVSIGEFRRFLREWLGDDTHISGEVWRTDAGLAISARTSGERGATFSGTQSDFDALVQKAAEHIYVQTQPYRYANYVRNQRRFDEARAVYLRLTESSSQLERGWAWQGISTLPAPIGSSNRNASWALRKANAAYPDYTLAYASLTTAEVGLGHDEAALAAARTTQQLLDRSSIPDVDPAYLGIASKSWSTRLPMLLGDYSQVVSIARSGLEVPDQSGQRDALRNFLVTALALQHDGRAARAALYDMPRSLNANTATPGRRAVLRFQVDAFCENWGNVLALEAETERAIEMAARIPAIGNPFDRTDVLLTGVYPWLALAKAKTGDKAGAETLIARTPGDCYNCSRVRGLIASQAAQWGRADFWFAKSVHDGPSLPFAYANWGQSLAARSQPDAAIEEFKLANVKGPHFADPLEGWGEALIAQNRSDLALAKFAEAERYAPNWGRLHLKWGEALGYVGETDEARAQFQKASTLDLTAADKAELARQPLHG